MEIHNGLISLETSIKSKHPGVQVKDFAKILQLKNLFWFDFQLLIKKCASATDAFFIQEWYCYENVNVYNAICK